MKLLFKRDNEVIDVIFEDCDGNLRVVNKNDTSKEGEYGSIRAFLKDFKDAPSVAPDYTGNGDPKYARQYRYARTEKGKLKKKEANKRYYLRRKNEHRDNR